jgi:hypothetical protein
MTAGECFWMAFRITSFLILLIMAPWQWATAASGSPNSGKETVSGYLVDLVCVKEEAGKVADFGPDHSKKCLQMPVCSRGGFAILLPSKEVLSLDDRSNELARKVISNSHKEKGFVVKATGIRQGSFFHVLRMD